MEDWNCGRMMDSGYLIHDAGCNSEEFQSFWIEDDYWDSGELIGEWERR